MTENKDKDKDNEKEKDKERENERSVINITDTLGLPQQQQQSERSASTSNGEDFLTVPQPQISSGGNFKSSCLSIASEIFTIDLDSTSNNSIKDETTIGTQRVYKKTSQNSILTLYLPTREIISCGSQPSLLKGILFVDPKLIQGYRVYAQLTLTFRYGREDEEVMGLRFCNEAIMSLHQIWPHSTSATDESAKEALTPLQDALIKRLGTGAHPFTLSLSPQSPPSVQLVPAKRYYGAPIGTSYDVRCFIADKADEKFRRRATVKMGVRVIHKTDVFSSSGPENFAALVNNPSSLSSSSISTTTTTTATAVTSSLPLLTQDNNKSLTTSTTTTEQQFQHVPPSIVTTNSNIVATTSSTATVISKQNQISQCVSSGGGSGIIAGGVSGSGGNGFGCSSGGIIGGNNPAITSTIINHSNFSTINNTATTTLTTITTTTTTISTNNTITTSTTTEPYISSSTQLEPMKHKKSERVDSFPKIRLSPKSFRFSGRFGRSKSEVERGPSDPFYNNYSKSFQEVDKYDCSGGPQGAVDKPFLLQEGRVSLRASLNKSWYTHGEDVVVTVNVKNDSKKTVRRMRVCAIQHVDVCMFNNGKFKNIVADSDTNTGNTSSDQTSVGPGKSLNSTFILKPKRGPTKNWIALEDALQRSSEPDEITGSIAASAVRTLPPANSIGGGGVSPSGIIEDRNVFAIYVSYYVKVKLTLSGMGGELSLKLPFSLVHVDTPSPITIYDPNKQAAITNELTESVNRICLMSGEKNQLSMTSKKDDDIISCPPIKIISSNQNTSGLNKIGSIEDEIQITINSCITSADTISTTHIPSSDNAMDANNSSIKRKLIRSGTAVENDLFEDECIKVQNDKDIKNCDTSTDGNASSTIDSTKQPNYQQTICAQVHSSSDH